MCFVLYTCVKCCLFFTLLSKNYLAILPFHGVLEKPFPKINQKFTQIATLLQNWRYKYSCHLTKYKLENFILLYVCVCLCIMFKMVPVYAQTFVSPSVCYTFSQAKWVMKPNATNFSFLLFSRDICTVL